MTIDTEALDKGKKGRELLDLKVNEVSPVDRPAVLEDWVVVKRHKKQEDSMGAFDSDQDGTGAEEIGYQWVDVDLEKRLEADLISAIKPAAEFLEAVEKGESDHIKEDVLKALPADLKTAITRTLAFLGKVVGGKYPFPAPAGKADDNEKATQKAIGDAADWFEKEDILKELPADLKTALTRVMAFLRKVGAGGYPMPAAKTEPAKKNQEDQKPEGSDESDIEARVEAKFEEMLKGKRFTDARKDGVANLVKQSFSLLSEVDADAAKAILGDIVKGLKGEVKWAAAPATTPKDTKKELEDALEKALKPFGEKLAGVSKTVEDIVKTRGAPQSDGQDTTDKPVKKDDTEDKWGGLPAPSKRQ